MTPSESVKKEPPKPKPIRVYILKFRLPVGLSLDERKEDEDRMGEHFRYHYSFETRRKVGKLRSHYRFLVYRYSIPFHGLKIVREEDLELIEKWAKQADEEFSKLSPNFHVQATPIPIDLNPERKGGIEQAIHDAAADHIYGRVIDRLTALSKKGGDLSEKSRRSLLDLTEKLKQWNILGSKDIDDKLVEMTQQFAIKTLKPVLSDLESEVKKLSSEGVWVEL